MSDFQGLPFQQTRQEEAQGRPIGDEKQGEKEQQKEGEGGFIELDDGTIESGAGNKEVQAHRGGIIADTQICKEYNAQVDRIDPKPVRQGYD